MPFRRHTLFSYSQTLLSFLFPSSFPTGLRLDVYCLCPGVIDDQTYTKQAFPFCRDELIQRQLQERHSLQLNINHVREAQKNEMEHLKTIMFSTLPAEMKDRLQKQFEQSQSRQSNPSPSYNSVYDLSM